tara:strand:- start:6040 stop:6327 length:288 start_codon:yes stop_codon:yes gene_type:complete
MAGGPPWEVDWDLKKELVDQALHVVAAFAVFFAVYFIPWPWNAAAISLVVMIERERCQHKWFPMDIFKGRGWGSLLDIIVWTAATGLAVLLLRNW